MKNLFPFFFTGVLLIFFLTNCSKDDKVKTPIITDGDGNQYDTVRIGNQVWLSENLKTTRFNDGTQIQHVTDSTQWDGLTSPAYCWYNNDKTQYGDVYGGLYNWYAVNSGKLCPHGWHVPSYADWDTLTTFLMGYSSAGGKLKEEGTIHWKSPNINATNITGFTALPGGGRGFRVEFENIGVEGYWWSSTSESEGNAYGRMMAFYGEGLDYFTPAKVEGLSVRCLKD